MISWQANRGPSYFTVQKISDVKVIHVRFIERSDFSQGKSDNEEKHFCAGNLKSHATDKFVELHRGNSFCQPSDLSVLH